MSQVTLVPAPSDRPAEIVGYIEAFSSEAVIGWVWLAGRDERLSVELRCGDLVLARTVADGMRDDLARNGIGDGKHAFELAIPSALKRGSSEWVVIAVSEAGQTSQLGVPPLDPSGTSLAHLKRGIEMLIGSQRVLHRNVQTALLREASSDQTVLAEIVAQQSQLLETVSTIEVFLARLEQSLISQRHRAEEGGITRALPIVAAVSALAMVLSSVALWRAVVSG